MRPDLSSDGSSNAGHAALAVGKLKVGAVRGLRRRRAAERPGVLLAALLLAAAEAGGG
eukprot:SAG31_NODE_46658_length_253_cov_1.006494_1_plen_57_part_01